MVYMLWVFTYDLLSNNMQTWWCSQYNLVHKHRIMWFYPDLTLPHLNKCILSYNPWLSHGLWNLTDENINSLCCLLWIFETRKAIMIMTNKHHDCEEDIMMLDIIKIITQL